VLFSGNYADLSGKPTLSTWPAQVVSFDSAANITADWVNTAFPWGDPEVANVLSLNGASVSNSSVVAGNAQLLSLVLGGQGNLLGALWPTMLGTAEQVLQLSFNGQMQWVNLTVPTMTAGQWIVGQSSGTAAARTISGNVSVSSTGVTTIGTSTVEATQVAEGSLTGADISSNFNPTNFSTGNLTVTSQANLAGGLWPTTAGTVGQLFQSDANGNLIWAADNTATSLSSNIVTATALADGSVGTAQLGASALESTHVIDGSLTGSDLSTSMTFTGDLSVGGQLLVIGTANLSGILFPVTLGSANQMLMVDSSGQLQWVSNLSGNGLTGGSITSTHLATGSVGNAQVLDGTIATADIADGSIGSTQLASGNLTTSLFATNSVGDSELQDDIALTGIVVAGNATLGTNAGNTLRLNGTLVGGSAGGNLWTSANLMPSVSGLNLGSSSVPLGEISAVTATVTSSNLFGIGGNLHMDVANDGIKELTLSGGKLGLGTTSPSANLHVAGNMIHTTGRRSRGVQTVTSSTNLGTASMVLADTTSGNLTLTLPSASSAPGSTIHIKKTNRDHGYVRVVASDNIDGQGSVFLKNSGGVLAHLEMLSNGSTWLITSHSEGASSSQGGYMLVDVSGGPTASFYPVSYTNVTPDLTGSGNFTFKSNVIVLKWIPPGVFTMGNTTISFGPEHEVTITEGFWAGVFEVTQLQWLQVMGSHPYGSQDFNNSGTSTDPVHRVSWEDIRGSSATYNWPNTTAVGASTFMGNLQAKTGLNFDLPTEAEWEYTCRAGTTTLWSYGDTENGDYMWYSTNNTPSGTKEVASKLPNPWGLYDMHGNVYEWCLDWSNASYPSYDSSLAQSDPTGALSSSNRVGRGGAIIFSAASLHSAARNVFSPGFRGASLGLRLFFRRR
jgi:formylglycine-generating enzyme required for sulfatase activity